MASTAVFVVSDHGFTTNAGSVDVAAELVAAGLKAAPDSTDVVLASSGQAVALHVAGRDPERIAKLVSFVQSREWGGVSSLPARGSGDPHGRVPGTFALELIHVANAERAPDVLLTFPWSSEPNTFGVCGLDRAYVTARRPHAGQRPRQHEPVERPQHAAWPGAWTSSGV
jgi:pimeloyl-ACP methyl ester carboxylesterase